MKTLVQLVHQHRLLSFLSVFCVLIFFILRLDRAAPWKEKKTIANDVCNYYGYLPAVLIYGDLSLKFKDTLRWDIREQLEHVWYKKSENEYVRVFKMTSGCAILWAPFFKATQWYIGRYPPEISERTGYSRFNHFMLNIAAIFYTIAGLFFLRKVLLRYFSDVTAAIVIVLVSAGTNLFYYVVYEPGMSHAYTFFLFSALLFCTIRWNERQTWLSSLSLAFLVGFLTLVRPVNLFAVLIPLFWGVNSWDEMKRKIRSVFSNWKKLAAMIVFFFIPLLPQLFYWKAVTGHWLFYSYNDERFFFSDPQIMNGLFSWRKGWFIYTPLMLPGIPGLLLAFRKRYDFLLPALFFFPVCFYVVFSWWCWWYGGSFGMRSLIDYYPLWLLLVAVLVEACIRSGWVGRVSVIAVLVFGIHLNLFQTYQYSLGIIHYHGMTKRAYFALWGRSTYPLNYKELIDEPDYKKELQR